MTRRMRDIARTWMAISVLIAAGFGAAGCGATMSAMPIQDIRSIAGRWDGSLSYQRAQYGTTNVGAEWIIREDGTYEIITPRWRAAGTLSIREGRIFFDSDRTSGFYADGRRASGVAYMREDAQGKYLLSMGDPDMSGTWWRAK